MFVAHTFAGYLWTRQYIKQSREKVTKIANYKYYIVFGMFCAVLPDFDLLYFYTIDNRQHAHHEYWTHMPFFWMMVSAGLYSIGRWVLRKNLGVYSIILLANTCLHLILDTFAGGIYWLYPFSDAYVLLIPITPRYDWWVWNFILHWIFIMELFIVTMAVIIFRRDHNIRSIMIGLRSGIKKS